MSELNSGTNTKAVQPRSLWWRILLVACAVLSASGCNELVAEKLVEAPNLQLPDRGKDASPALLAAHYVSRQLRVGVGPPAASLSVWIVEPYLGDVPPFEQVISATTHPALRPALYPNGTVFFLHGLDLDKEYIVNEYYSLLIAHMGYRVVLVDLRGHGRSTGERITYGATEAKDMIQILDECQRQGLIVGPVGVMGISYGASVGICWAGIDPRVRAVVAIEPFSLIRDTADTVRAMLEGHRVNWMFSDGDLQDILVRVARLGAFDPDSCSPLAAIAKMKTPVLLIHGMADGFVPPRHSIRLNKAALSHSRLILVDGVDHIQLPMGAIGLIYKESREWFQTYLPAAQR